MLPNPVSNRTGSGGMTAGGGTRRNPESLQGNAIVNPSSNCDGFFETQTLHDILSRSSSNTNEALNYLLDQYNDLVVAFNSLKLQHNELEEFSGRSETCGLGIEGASLPSPQPSQSSRFKLLKRRSYRSIRDSVSFPVRLANNAVSNIERSETPVSSISDPPSSTSSRVQPGTPNARKGTPAISTRPLDSPSRDLFNQSPIPRSGSPNLQRLFRGSLNADDDPFHMTRTERDGVVTATITTEGSAPNRTAIRLSDRLFFIITVFPRTGTPYRVEKSWSDLVAFHEGCVSKAVQYGEKMQVQFPPIILFEPPYSPYRLVQRNMAVAAYIENIRSFGLFYSDLLSRFLSPSLARATPELPERAQRQGYLVQRVSDERVWVLRHCTLYHNVLVLRDAFGDDDQRIDLENARIGRQHAESYRSSENSNFHALLILESADRQDTVCHVLCAESDGTRDAWIDALVNMVAFLSAGIEMIDSASRRIELAPFPALDNITSPETSPRIPHDTPHRTKNGIFRLDAASPASPNTSTRRFWSGLRSFGVGHSENGDTSIFGLPLREAVRRGSLPGDSPALSPVPAVVRHCIDFLEQLGGIEEEGIYRQNGSQTAIKALAERCATGDVDLISESSKRHAPRDLFDPYTVSGLLKLYIRELPDSLLTGALAPEFIGVIESGDRADYVTRLGQLMYRLPSENYSLLRLLCNHMNKVAANADVNKMTVKNIAIVLSPSLVIPTSLLSIFLTEFSQIFALGEQGDRAPLDVSGNVIPAEASQPLRIPPTVENIHEHVQDADNTPSALNERGACSLQAPI